MKFKSARLFFLIIVGYVKRRRLWLASGAVVLIIVSVLLTKLSFLYTHSSLRIGAIGTFQEHDLPEEVTRLISAGLVKADRDGKMVPNLLSGWEVNNDATSFKFKLKDELKWSDGIKIKSSDLELAIPNTNVTYPDERTIQFDLKESYSPLPSLLTKPIFRKGALIGTGPYRLKKIEKSRIFITKITLEASDRQLPTIHIRFYPNEKVAVTGFNLGEVQALLGVANPKDIPTSPLISINRKTDYSKIVTIQFQTKDSLLQNRSLRQALAFQAPQIDGMEVANNPYSPNSWAYNSAAKKYLSNPKEAEEAMKRAMSSISEDKMDSEIILTTTPNLEEVGRVIIGAWKNLGFDIKLRVESGIPQNFQALLITQSIPTDPDQYFLWHATQIKTNLTKYDSKRADKDLEDGRKIITEEERREKYFDLQKTLLEDAPAIFLYFPKYNIVYLKKVENLLNKVLLLGG